MPRCLRFHVTDAKSFLQQSRRGYLDPLKGFSSAHHDRGY